MFVETTPKNQIFLESVVLVLYLAVHLVSQATSMCALNALIKLQNYKMGYVYAQKIPDSTEMASVIDVISMDAIDAQGQTLNFVYSVSIATTPKLSMEYANAKMYSKSLIPWVNAPIAMCLGAPHVFPENNKNASNVLIYRFHQEKGNASVRREKY